MSYRLVSLSLALLSLFGAAAPAFAGETGAVHNTKTVRAMSLETYGVATSAADVLRQGGFAVAGTADWTKAAAEHVVAGTVASGRARWASAPAAD